MPQFVCLKNGQIVCFMSGENMTLEDAAGQDVDAVVPLPHGTWDYGDTLPTQAIGSVFIGVGLPSNKLGSNGDKYIDIETGIVYQKNNNSWFL